MKYLSSCLYCNANLKSHWQGVGFDKCQNCGLIIRNPFPDETDLKVLYESAWQKPNEEMYEMGITNSLLSEQYVRELLKTLDVKSLSGKKILDFGAGKGCLMRALESAGAKVVGVEPFGYSFLREKNLDVYKELFDIPVDEKFDGIISMEVFEHLRNPWSEIKLLKKFLKPNSWLIISCPNPSSFNALLNGNKWSQANYPGHIIFSNSLTLKKMLNDLGFEKVNSLKWQIKYTNSIVKNILHQTLQTTGLDGATRVIGWT